MSNTATNTVTPLGAPFLRTTLISVVMQIALKINQGVLFKESPPSCSELSNCLDGDALCNLLIWILLLLAAPTWLWVAAADTILLQPVLSWTSSFVVPMALMSRLTQSIHLCFGLPLFLLLPGGTISRVFLPTYSWSRLFTWPNHLSLTFLHLSVMFSTFSLSLMSSFLTCSLSVWPHAHLHIFIFVTFSFFTWELALSPSRTA